MSQSLKIYTLDRLTFELKGQVINKFVSQKAPALFIYLLSHPRDHQRDVLAELFWSETTGKQALKNLRTVLSNLQKIGLADFLYITRQTLAIQNQDAIWVDYQMLESAIDSINEKLKRPYSPQRLFTEMTSAINLYEGDFLLGLKTNNAQDLDTWVTLERERLRSRISNIMFELLKLALENGEYTKGLEYGHRLLSMDSLWEEAVRLVMTLHAYNGNRTSAIQQYEEFSSILQKELEIPPESETTQLYRAIKTGRIKATAPQAKPNNLQQASNIFVENPTFMQAIHNHLNNLDNRLITLLGQGGVGKTRLAQHIAHQRLEDYRDGVFFISLASVTSTEFVAQAILNALSITHLDIGRTPKDTLIENLGDKHILLVLDNMEHLLDSITILQSILHHAPYSQLLVTSREQLQIQGEQVFTIPVLLYPQQTANSSDYPALKLFEQTAQRVKSDFRLSDSLEDVVRICQLIDGLPLAIVIAAGWVQFLPVAIIAQRIEENIDFLTISRRDLPERHRGITALMNTTWSSLTEQQQKILQKMSIFTGDFSDDAAEKIAGATLADLMALVSKSLLQSSKAGRYQQHELLRRYAKERENSPDILSEALTAHTAYFRDWIHQLVDSDKANHEQFLAIDKDYHNLWLIEHLSVEEQQQQILHLSVIVADYWIARGLPLDEGIQILETALPDASNDFEKVIGLTALGQLYSRTHQYEIAYDYLNTAAELSEPLADHIVGKLLNELHRVFSARGYFDDALSYLFRLIDLCEASSSANEARIQHLLAAAYLNIGTIYSQLGQNDDAEKYASRGLAATNQSGDAVILALYHNVLGIIALDYQDYATAHQHFADALAIANDIKHTRYQSIFSGNLAEAVYKQGDFEQSYTLYIETLSIAQRLNNQKTMLNVLEQLAILLGLHLHLPDNAAVVYGTARQLRDSLQLAIEPRQQEEFDRLTSGLITAIGQSKFEQAVEEGYQLSFAEISQYLADITLK